MFKEEEEQASREKREKEGRKEKALGKLQHPVRDVPHILRSKQD